MHRTAPRWGYEPPVDLRGDGRSKTGQGLKPVNSPLCETGFTNSKTKQNVKGYKTHF